jgi:hypothetical protein
VRLPSGIGSHESYAGGSSFFDMLFGGAPQPRQAIPQRRTYAR